MRSAARVRALWWTALACALLIVVGRLGRDIQRARRHHAPRDVRLQLRQALREHADALPVYGGVPDFALTDQQGRAVTRQTWRGSVWIADFIFTRCAGQCLTMTAQLRELQRQLPPPIQFVSISVDPLHDTPAVLADYAAHAGAVPSDARWRLLTGEPAAIYQLSREGLRLSLEAQGGSPEEPILHSVRFVLVDQQGRIRGYYDGTDADAIERLQLDAEALLRGDAS